MVNQKAPAQLPRYPRELGLNAFGERVWLDHAGNLRVDRRRQSSAPKTPSTKPKPTPAVQYRAPTLVEQVQAEVAKHPGVIASVNEETGHVTTVMVPKPYYLTMNLTPDERNALEAERKRLLFALRSMTPHERAKSMTRINVIEITLRTGRSNEEADRRKVERETQRKMERGEQA